MRYIRKGHPHSEKRKKEVSIWSKNLWKNPIHVEKMRLLNIGEGNPMYGTHHTKKWRREHSLRMMGKNNPLYGKHPSKEAIRKNRLAHRWKHLSPKTEFKKGMKTWNKGLTKFTDSRIRTYSKYLKGERNPMWQNGISLEPYSPEFDEYLKEEIRKRDNRSCQHCGLEENGHKLPVHHIDYNKKNNKPENHITLCLKCHGLTQVNREFWTNYFSSLIRAVYALALPIPSETALTVADFDNRTAFASGGMPPVRISS